MSAPSQLLHVDRLDENSISAVPWLPTKLLEHLSRSSSPTVTMSSALYTTVAPLIALASFLWLYGRRSSRPRAFKNIPLPPGLPIIGNLRDLPSSYEWLTYHKWCKEFGTYNTNYKMLDWTQLTTPGPYYDCEDTDILYLSITGTSFIILDSAEVTIDLFDKRSAIYSGK